MVSLDESTARSSGEALAAASEDARRVADSAPPNRSAALARLIEADIIPRLMLTTVRRRGGDGRSSAALEVDEEDIDGFARMMIGLDIAKAEFAISAALDRGVALETVLLKLLAPTAQRLGVMWTEDLCTFTDVTVGLCALQSLMRSYTTGDFAEPSALHDGRALIAAAPGEQHTFGVLILEAFLRRAGWDVIGLPLADRAEVIASVERRSFAVVGFSLAREAGLDDLRALVVEVRARSRNRGVSVLVGGRVFNDNPKLVRVVGADATAADADRAVIASHHLLCSTVQTH